MGKILMVYATRTGETTKIADFIAEGIRMSGHDVDIKKANEVKNEEDLNGYDGYIFGSPTYHGQMVDPVKQLLFIAERADLEGKPGGSFGAFGWSGEAPERIYDTMENIFKMKMVNNALMLKASWVQGGMKAAQEYGKEVTELF